MTTECCHPMPGLLQPLHTIEHPASPSDLQDFGVHLHVVHDGPPLEVCGLELVALLHRRRTQKNKTGNTKQVENEEGKKELLVPGGLTPPSVKMNESVHMKLSHWNVVVSQTGHYLIKGRERVYNAGGDRLRWW